MFFATIGSFDKHNRRYYFEAATLRSVGVELKSENIAFFDHIQSCSGEPYVAGSLGETDVEAFLVEIGFIEHDNKPNSCNIPEIFGKYVGINRHISVHFLLTQYCNLGCVYCYNGSDSYQLKNNLTLSTESCRKALSLFFRYVDPRGSISFNFLGGEPLLNWASAHTVLEDWKSIAEQEGFKGEVRFSIQTNLTFIPPDFISDVTKHDVDIVVEVDGNADIHDELRPHKSSNVSSFEKTLQNCKILVENEIKFRCKAVLTDLNVNQVDDIQDLHLRMGAQSSSYGMVRPVDSDYLPFDRELLPKPYEIKRTVENSIEKNGVLFEDISDEIRSKIAEKKSCGTVGCYLKHASIFTVTCDSKIYTCPWFVGTEEHFLCDLSSTEIPPSKVIKAVEKIGIELDPTCAECEYFKVCGGGCPVTLLMCGETPELIDQVRQNRCNQIIPVTQHLITSDLL